VGVHDELLEGDAAFARRAVQVCAVERAAQGLRREFGEQWVQRGIGFRPMQTAEAPRIVEPQHPTAIHANVPVIVALGRGVLLDQAQASRHAEMQDHGAGVDADQNVLCAPLDAAHGLAANGGLEVRSDGPAKAPFAHDDLDDAPLQQSRRNAASRRFYFGELGRVTARAALLDLRFFVRDVLAHDRIELLRFQFVRMQALVLGGRIVMTRARRRDQFDFVAHRRSLHLDALGAQFRHHHVDAALFDGAQAPGRHSQAQEPLFGFGPEAMRMQIGQKAAPFAIVRMGYRIARFRTFARDLADSRHGVNL
jgi:hypothetical protein